jgi:hypothetical protein
MHVDRGLIFTVTSVITATATRTTGLKMVTRILAWLAARDEVSWLKFIVACFLIMALLGL